MDVLCERKGPLGKEQAPINLWAFSFCLTSEQSSFYFKFLLGCREHDNHQDFRTQCSTHCVKYSSENYIIYQADVIPSRGSGDGANHIIQL